MDEKIKTGKNLDPFFEDREVKFKFGGNYGLPLPVINLLLVHKVEHFNNQDFVERGPVVLKIVGTVCCY